MAAANMAYKMPQEPCPLPSLESDEESFVVLGQSIPDCSTDEYIGPIDLSVVAEAKRLINIELDALEQTRDEPGEKNEKEEINKDSVQEPTKMETSAVLPAMPEMEKNFESTNAISIVSFSNDMSSEQVQTKISQIIDENICLKDTVLQNNMTLKAQYEKIVAWQDEVQKVHQAHKEKLLEAKIFIDNLKKEKENLKQELSKVADKKKNLETEMIDLKRSLKEKEIASNEVLVQRSDDNIKEFQLDVANTKIKDLEAEIEKLKIENKKLIDEANEVHVKEEVTLEKMKELQSQLENLTLSEVAKQENIKRLEPELQKLLEECNNANGKVKELEEEVTRLKQREEALLMATNTLKTQLEISDRNEEVANLRTQLAQIQTTLTQVEYSRGQAYAQVNHLTQELQYIKSQENSNDELCALKMQLDLYKADFAEERHAREVIKGEKDGLEGDIQNLQRRNQQLQEEIELLRNEHDYVVYPNPRSPRSDIERETMSHSRSSNEGSSFKCPKCNFGLKSMSQLQNHVYRCIELDDHLP